MQTLKPLFILIVLILIGVVVWLVVVSLQGLHPSQNLEVRQSEGKVLAVDLETLEGEEALPVGFPAGVPVNADTLEQSFRVNYDELNAYEATIVYRSDESREDIESAYREYFASAGYDILQEDTTSNHTIILGRLDNDTLSFGVSEQEGEREVAVSAIIYN